MPLVLPVLLVLLVLALVPVPVPVIAPVLAASTSTSDSASTRARASISVGFIFPIPRYAAHGPQSPGRYLLVQWLRLGSGPAGVTNCVRRSSVGFSLFVENNTR